METKICKKCNKELDISNFRKANERISIKTGELKIYYKNDCRKCESDAGCRYSKLMLTKNPNLYKNEEYRKKQNKRHKKDFFIIKQLDLNVIIILI
jgi:hypothetical protein